MLADDVVETIGELAHEWGAADVGEILIGLGLAPDEVTRFLMVALWSVQRVELSLRALEEDGLGPPLPVSPAAWLDGFAIGLSVARRERDRPSS